MALKKEMNQVEGPICSVTYGDRNGQWVHNIP